MSPESTQPRTITPPKITVSDIARCCHEANRVLCESVGDNSQKEWGAAEAWQRESAIKGVQFAMENPSATPEDQHNAWMKEKLDQGWQFGPVKDPENKLHPCLIPYDGLPAFQQAKDHLFRGIVTAMSPLCPPEQSEP